MCRRFFLWTRSERETGRKEPLQQKRGDSRIDIVMETVEERRASLSRARRIVIHSGNILHKILKTSEEICESFCGTIDHWLSSGDAKINQETSESLYISSEHDIESPDNRSDLKISVKLFLQENSKDVVERAVKRVIAELKCEKVDSVLLSLPPTSSQPDVTFRSVNYDDVKEAWTSLEDLREKGLIGTLGVCDFDGESLIALHKQAKIKPITDQINLLNCCTPPDDLAAFAADNEINLLTHNDPAEILPPETLKFILENIEGGHMWKTAYLVRYSTVVRYREVVKNKGYILCLQRELD